MACPAARFSSPSIGHGCSVFWVGIYLALARRCGYLAPCFQQHVFKLGAWAQALESRVSATPDLGSALLGAALQVGWWLCSVSRGPLVLSHLLGAISPTGRKSVLLVSPCLVAVVAVRPIGRASAGCGWVGF